MQEEESVRTCLTACCKVLCRAFCPALFNDRQGPTNAQCNQCCLKCCKTCCSRKFCIPFFKILGLYFLVMSFGAIIYNSIEIPKFISQKQFYIESTLKYNDCGTWCGLLHNYTVGKNCCSRDMTECFNKNQCYQDKIAEYDSAIHKYTLQRELSIVYLAIAALVLTIFCIRRRYKKAGQRQQGPRLNENIDESLHTYVQEENAAPADEYQLQLEFQRLLEDMEKKQKKGLRPSMQYRDSTANCSVCLEPFLDEKAIQLHCMHIFHSKCIKSWVVKNRSCPLCRAPL